jgi:DNA-directed RNA polymerase subunit RPC12/RpoP
MPARPRDLQCPNGCPEGTFEALNAPLIVDRQGRYVSHDGRAASYRCTSCGSIAVDLWAAAREMRHDREANPPTLTCPACGTLMLPPIDDPRATTVECPVCGQQFAIEEGMPHLHGGGGGEDEPH